MHYWTKEAFIEILSAHYEAKGWEITACSRGLFEWIGNIVEMAYDDGFEDGKEAARQAT